MKHPKKIDENKPLDIYTDDQHEEIMMYHMNHTLSSNYGDTIVIRSEEYQQDLAGDYTKSLEVFFFAIPALPDSLDSEKAQRYMDQNKTNCTRTQLSIHL